MMKIANKLIILNVVTLGMFSQSIGMEQTELDPNKKKDFLLVKNEIIRIVGKDFRRKNPYINLVRLNREVASDSSLGIVTEIDSPYKTSSVDKMFHKKVDVKNYILFKREETNSWIHYTQKFIDHVDLKQYNSYPTFSNGTFSTMFHEFLDYKKKEQGQWGNWLKIANRNPEKLVLAPKKSPHAITGVDELHNMGLSGAGTEVCVWDCGFFENKHVKYVRDIPSLPGNYEEGDDPGNANHGTHVSGIVGGKKSAGSAKGVAFGADIYPISYNGIDQFIKEIQDSKARVINGSFSFLMKKNDLGSLIRLTEELKKNDRLLVMASGNSSKFLNDPQPTNFQNFWFNGMWVGPHYPFILSKNEELMKRIILVGSMKEDGVTVSRFSNLPGLLPNHFIFAPGENVKSTVGEDKFDRYSGTSMAAPHVTGIIALIASSFPNLEMTEVKEVVMSSGDAFWEDNSNKFGKEYKPEVHGKGRINAVKAFKLAQERSLSKAKAPSLLVAKSEIANRIGIAHGKGRLWINSGFTVNTMNDNDDMDLSDPQLNLQTIGFNVEMGENTHSYGSDDMEIDN